MRINVRFAGSGGQGVILASVLLAKGYGLGEDYNISQTQSYGPEARGGACKAEVVISDEEIDYMKVDEADVFIALNQAGFDKYKEELQGRSMLVKKAQMLPAECIVRGYLEGSALKEYKKSGTVGGIKMPEGMLQGDKLPEPLFTPSTSC